MELLNKELKLHEEERLAKLENCREGVREVRNIINSQTKYNGVIRHNFPNRIKIFNNNCNEYDEMINEFNNSNIPKISITNDNFNGLYNTLNTDINIQTREINYKLSNVRYYSGI